MPRPYTNPPSSCPRNATGLMTWPMSTASTAESTRTVPVSASTATSVACAHAPWSAAVASNFALASIASPAPRARAASATDRPPSLSLRAFAAATDVPHAEREADTATGRPRLIRVDLGGGAVEERAKIRSVPRVAGRRRVARARDVAASQLERRDPELARDEVEMGLRREHVLRLTWRTHMPAGHVV